MTDETKYFQDPISPSALYAVRENTYVGVIMNSDNIRIVASKAMHNFADTIREQGTEISKKKFTDQLSKVSKIFAQNLDSIFAEIQ